MVGDEGDPHDAEKRPALAALVSQTPAIGQGMSSKPIRIDVEIFAKINGKR